MAFQLHHPRKLPPLSLSPFLSLSLCRSKIIEGGETMLLSFRISVLVFFVVLATAELLQLQHPPKADGSLSIMVVGDWGRKGTHNQSEVAYQMGVIGEKLGVDFVISTGDNFYDNGLEDVNDPAFHDSFTNIYTAPSLQIQWYNVLGNHDYRGDVLAQLSPILTNRDNKWFCHRSYIIDTEIVEFFFVDTTPFENKYFAEEEDHTYDWRGVLPREHYISNLLKDVDLALRESTAKWKIVVGHHTILSAGQHGCTQELIDQLLPILEANNVDFYINGHDHCLQHIISDDSRLQFITSGGGSKAWRGDIKEWNKKEMKFYYDGQGFVVLKITQSDINVVYYNIFGKVMHKWTTSKLLSSIM